MMNQVNNLVQWKNLTDDEKAGFDFEGYRYEMQCRSNDWLDIDIPPLDHNVVCRLVIQSDKWYALVTVNNDLHFERGNLLLEAQEDGVVPLSEYLTLRPAKPSDIPKPAFKDGAFYPVIIKGIHGELMRDIAQYDNNEFVTALHTNPRCESGYYLKENFSWIGEELNIEWGKS